MTKPFAQLTIQEIKAYLQAKEELTEEDIQALQADSRKGVLALLHSFEKKQSQLKQLQAERDQKLAYEKQYWAQSYSFIAGVDEVGRGPLAGPVLAAAVVLPTDIKILGVKDSKQLSAKKRQKLKKQIQDQALAYAYGQVDAAEIDQMNILQASKLAMMKAIEALSLQVDVDFILADAVQLPSSLPQLALIKGDDRSLSIGCASILAKEKRDQLMVDYGQTYPGYGFEHHKGYGTAEHLQALSQYGPSPIHRLSFQPVKNYLK